jgi:hypothetical protein
MNNEPVAWMVEDDEDISFIMNGKGLAKPDASWKSVTPVYTHPAKTLKDYEIRQVIDEHWEKTSNVNLFDFARAILKRASEK